VSKGPAQKQVPNVVGKSEQDAEQALSQAGFNVGKITTDSTSTQPQGTVIHQSPGGGSQAKPGTSVNLTVSGGGVTVPSVVGESQGQAIGELSQAGLTYTVVTVADRSGVAPGTVVDQNPAAGATVPRQTQVTLQVTGETTPSPTPSSPSPSPTESPSPSPSTPPDGQGNSASPSPPPSPSPSPSSSPHLRLTA
jgi:eukaryotic-like serine/threonine-protein kinase